MSVVCVCFSTTPLLAYLQRGRETVLSIAEFLEARSQGHGVRIFLILIDTAKLLSKKDVATHSGECLSPHVPTYSQLWLVSIFRIFSNLDALGAVEGRVIAVLMCTILICSIFKNLTCTYCLVAFSPVFARVSATAFGGWAVRLHLPPAGGAPGWGRAPEP